MLNNTIEEYFVENLERLNENLKIGREDFDEESIHKYRLNIKKIKSISSLFKDIFKHNIIKSKDLNLIKEIYRPSSLLRDLQIQMKLIKRIENEYSIHVSEEIKSFIESEIKQEKKNFKESNGLINQEKIYKYLSPFQKHLDDEKLIKSVKSWVHKNIESFSHYKKEEYHDLRKVVKQTFYISELLYHSGEIDEGIVKELKHLGQNLGEWHDIHLFMSKVKKINDDDKILPILSLIEKELTIKIENYLKEKINEH